MGVQTILKTKILDTKRYCTDTERVLFGASIINWIAHWEQLGIGSSLDIDK